MANKLSNVERSIVAEKLMEWGNLVFVGLVIAQFVPGTGSFHGQFFFAGVIGIIMAYAIGIFLMKMGGGEKK